jgi:hypothetical protein
VERYDRGSRLQNASSGNAIVLLSLAHRRLRMLNALL